MYCIRCGRKIPEEQHFCGDCAGTFEKVLEESAYLNTRVNLSAREAGRQMVRPAPQEMTISVATEKKKAPGLGRWRAAVLGLLALCIVLAGALCWGIYSYFGDDATRGRTQQWVQEEENARLSAQIAKLQTALDEAQAAAADTGVLLEEAQLEILRLEEELNQKVLQGSQTDLTARALQQENLVLQQENDTIKQENAALGDQITALESGIAELGDAVDGLTEDLQTAQKELETAQEELAASLRTNQNLTSEIASLRATANALLRKANFMDRNVAFVEAGDPGVYHTYDCARFLKRNYWAYSVRVAESNGYRPCPDCH